MAVNWNIHVHHHHNQELEKIMADLNRISAAVTQLETDNATLITLCRELLALAQAGAGGNTDQAALDALAARVEAIDTADVAEVAADQPPAPPTP